MTTLITRLLANEGSAADAAKALEQRGFNEDSIAVISGSDASAAMEKSGVSEEAASAYSSGIASGNALVAVRAPFGMAGTAVTALKKFKPIDVGLESEELHIEAKTDPEISSSIIKGNKKFLTGKGVTERGMRFTPFGFPMLSSNQKGRASVDTSTVSAKFGMSTIKQPSGKKNVSTGNPTPFSSLFGMKTIIQPKQRKSISRDNPTPFSSALGWPTIIEND